MGRVAKTISLLLAAIAMSVVLTFMLFINKPVRKTYQDFVALDGKQPFGAPNRGASDSVVLYRKGLNGVTCYEAFYSKELHDHLSSKDGQVVTVEYDTRTNFGKVHGYYVHSIDGLLLTDENGILRHDFAGVSGAASAGEGTIGPDDCW